MAKDYILLTPGPTPLPPSVSRVLGEPILHHRTKEFGTIFTRVLERMQKIYRTKGIVLMQTTSGTGAMEAAVANLLSPGDKALVASTGVFGNRWSKILKAYAIEHDLLEAELGRAVDAHKFEEALKAKGKGLKAVFLTHTETSTGVLTDLKKFAALIRNHSDALVVVDSISGLGAEELEMDAWDLDVVVTGSQKGLMNGPGLAFVALSEKGRAAVQHAKLPRFYWDWRTMEKSIPNKETPYTPAVNLVCAQDEALRLLLEEGIEDVWARTRGLAEWTRSEVKKLGFPIFAKDPANVLTSFSVPEGMDSQALIEKMLAEHHVSMAGGQEKLKGKIVRIAHMGYIRKQDLEKGFDVLKKTLAAMKQPA